MKSLRNDIDTLRCNAEKILGELDQKVNNPSESTWGMGKDFSKTADELRSLLKRENIPESYKVAVVGKIKAGKSSFINQLLESNLAGVNTNPETAAETTFRHGDSTKAIITFLSVESWNKLKKDYEEGLENSGVKRVEMWESFRQKTITDNDGKESQAFDLLNLENDYVKLGGHRIEIALDKVGTKQLESKTAETKFRDELKKFTSSKHPQHCLVEKIEIETPAKILDEGISLIDTPGFDDTERFRVSLTEETVKGVDAILFLTQSGVSYTQPEKEFILTLLRKGIIKQLIFVITQIDKTYEQHLNDNENDGVDPDSIAKHIRDQEVRILDEIGKTLNELIETDSDTMCQYRDQLGKITLVSTSATNHREWKNGKPIKHVISNDDPGAIEHTKKELLNLLSTESRLARTGHNIATGTESALERLLAKIKRHQAVLQHTKDGEVAQQKLATFRQKFTSACDEFQHESNEQITILQKNIEAKEEINRHIMDGIKLRAIDVLNELHRIDGTKHWAKLRSSNWGYLEVIGAKVAYQIFPKVQEMLTGITEPFSGFIDNFEGLQTKLSEDSENLAKELELASVLNFNLTEPLYGALKKSREEVDSQILYENRNIMSLLDDFVSGEVGHKIWLAHQRVAEIRGPGTTVLQHREVDQFYAELKRLLNDALTGHLNERIATFNDFLIEKANDFPNKARKEVEETFNSAEDVIRVIQEKKSEEQRNADKRECDLLVDNLEKVFYVCNQFLMRGKSSIPTSSLPTGIQSSGNTEAMDSEWLDEISSHATESLNRHRLKDGDSGWPWEKIFDPKLFKGCLRIALIDPYLADHHQLRNLKEFLVLVAETARPKEVFVLTKETWSKGSAANSRKMKQIEDDLFRDFGTILTIKVDSTIHDRCVICDHGLLFKLGRGLDIYKPAMGLASHQPTSRRVRGTEIDVFCTPEFINKDKQ